MAQRSARPIAEVRAEKVLDTTIRLGDGTLITRRRFIEDARRAGARVAARTFYSRKIGADRTAPFYLELPNGDGWEITKTEANYFHALPNPAHARERDREHDREVARRHTARPNAPSAHARALGLESWECVNPRCPRFGEMEETSPLDPSSEGELWCDRCDVPMRRIG